MAKWIDRAATWTFLTLSVYLLILTMTNISILCTAILTFFIVITIRFLLMKIPDKRWPKRGKQMQYAQYILTSWALMRRHEALKEIDRYLPNLLKRPHDVSIQLIQRIPEGDALDVNQLMDIWRDAPPSPELHLIVTCAVKSETHALADSLEKPSIRITDRAALLRMLCKTRLEPPAGEKAIGRHRKQKICLARYIQSIKPMKTCLYGLLFTTIYSINHSWIYLTSACLMFLLIAARIIFQWTSKTT